MTTAHIVALNNSGHVHLGHHDLDGWHTECGLIAEWTVVTDPLTCPTCLTAIYGPPHPQEQPMPDQGELTSVFECAREGRRFLDQAAERLEHVSGSGEFAQAAATIGCGYVQLAVLELQAEAGAGAAQHNERILEMQSVVADAHRALEGRVRAEQAEIELRIGAPSSPAADAAVKAALERVGLAPAAEVTEPVIWVVADEDGPIHASPDEAVVDRFIADNQGTYAGMTKTAVEVEQPEAEEDGLEPDLPAGTDPAKLPPFLARRYRPADDELTASGVGSLSEAIALALGDAYAGIEFEDPTFERGTEAVMAVLRERAEEAGRG
ncbi:hypothetical protein GCM10027258_62970 [Amycolatopsis stemonae]